MVLVDDAAEDVAPADLAAVRQLMVGQWGRELPPAMRSSPVVVLDVRGEHRLQVASGIDEEVVEALFTDSPHEALGECIGVSRQQHPIQRKTDKLSV